MRETGGPAIVEALSNALEPEEALLRCCGLPHCLLLESALRHPLLGRHSFLAVDPFDFLEVHVEGRDGLGWLAERLAGFPAAALPDLPPFQGGAAGLVSYDLGRQLEQLPASRIDEFGMPAMAIGLYDVVVAWDHADGRAWIISQGFPEVDPVRRRRRAERRAAQLKRRLSEAPRGSRQRPAGRLPPIRVEELSPEHAVAGQAGLASNFSEEGYLRTVKRAIDYVYAGDIFQVNLSQRLLHPAKDDSVALYRRLRRQNPAPFAGYFDLGDFQIVSASPERFLQVRDRRVQSRPIKGTRRRVGRPEVDRSAGAELCRSEKDRAENVMIVDLLRNDLSRVCEPDTVVVGQLCGLEIYEHVQHLVSVIEGRLREEYTPTDLVRAAFPGGSITGAPKIRAMEVIADLEPTARGAYCGALGYLGFDGSMDLNILIRTITAGRGWWQAPVGGGIVAQSDPHREYEETWHKAEGLIRAFE